MHLVATNRLGGNESCDTDPLAPDSRLPSGSSTVPFLLIASEQQRVIS